jgi:hypothetical protein
MLRCLLEALGRLAALLHHLIAANLYSIGHCGQFTVRSLTSFLSMINDSINMSLRARGARVFAWRAVALPVQFAALGASSAG